ncbi:MAG: class I SAM-dependent methyltransferase [Fervidobacterium sp.]|nr:class I SAM-dependent methyltransferase [Fervidobacterium sp.]
MSKLYKNSYHYYNDIAHDYDSMYNDEYWKCSQEHIKTIMEKYVSNFVNLKVLDIGSGTGNWARWVVERGAHVTLVEPAQNMMKIAEEKLKSVSHNCLFINDTIENVIEIGKYDVILLLGDVLSYVKDYDIVMRKILHFSKYGTLVFGTVDNYYSYLKDVVTYGEWKDFIYLKSNQKLPIGSKYGYFISRAFDEEDIRQLAERYKMEVLELTGLAIFKNSHLNERYGKYFLKEAEHLLFTLRVRVGESL